MEDEPDPTPPVDVEKQQGQVIVHVGGEMDIDRASLLQEALRTLIAQADCPPDIVLDLTDLAFCDSSGLNAFLQARLTAIQYGWRVILHAPNQQVTRLLELTGADTLFTIT